MITRELLKTLAGVQTIESIMSILSVDREKAIYYVYSLRKKGYVKTKRVNNKRVYEISPENRFGGWNYYELLNQNSPVKLSQSEVYMIHGKKPDLEETLIFAIKTGDLRTILSSLALFKKISNWPKLYRISKENNIQRHVGVLYDLSRKIMKTRKMTKRFRNLSLPPEKSEFQYIIPHLKSNDFKKIEQIWKVYLPFNWKDLEDYK